MPTKNIQWFQNRIVAQVSFISAIIGILTAVMAVLWNIRVTGEIAKDVERVKYNQEQQLIINTKLLTIIELSKK